MTRLLWVARQRLSWYRERLQFRLGAKTVRSWQICGLCVRPAWRSPIHTEYSREGRGGPHYCEDCCERLGLRTMRCPDCSPLSVDVWVGAVHAYYRTGDPGLLAL